MRYLLILLVFASLSHGQTPTPTPSDTTPIRQFWRAITPGGIYQVRLDRIQSVSTHEYTIAPITRVIEFTIETGGPVTTRFYYLETITPQSPLGLGQSGIDAIKSKAEEVANKVAGGDAPWKKVTKVYPTTTHAHTVEYRVSSAEDINKLMKSAQKCWETGRGEEIKID